MQYAVTGQAPITLERKITSGGKQIKTEDNMHNKLNKSYTVIMREMAPVGEMAPGCGKRSKKEIFNEQWPKYGTPGSPMAKTGYPFPR